MSNALKEIEPQIHAIAQTIEGVTFYKGIQVTQSLGFTNGSKAIVRHCDRVDYIRLPSLTGGHPSIWVSRRGIDALLLVSQTPVAIALRRGLMAQVPNELVIAELPTVALDS